MRVRCYPADYSACGKYRVIWSARELMEQGYDVHLDHKMTPTWAIDSRTKKVLGTVGLALEPDCDVVVVQRVQNKYVAEMIEHYQEQGVAVVADFDDDIARIPRSNAAYRSSRHDMWHYTNAQRVADLADMVTVSTPRLAEIYGKHGRVTVIPNRVPRRYLSVERRTRSTQAVLGVSGSVKSHAEDFAELRRVGLGTILEETGARFSLLGHGDPEEIFGVRGTVEEWCDLEDYPQYLADHFDVLAVALAPIPFNRAKSYLTPLVAASVGLPWVGSNTAEYRKLSKQGCGAVADTPSEWRRLLLKLLSFPDLRAEYAARGREVAAKHILEENVGQVWNAWTQARENRARRMRHLAGARA